MPFTTNTFTYAGGAQTFTISLALGYLNTSDIQVFVVGELDGGDNQIFRAFTFDSEFVVRVTDPLTVNDDVTIQRSVSPSVLVVDFETGGDITARNLMLLYRQTFMLQQELLDGRISGMNLLDIVSDTTASAVAAAASAVASASSAADALTSEGNASTSEGASSVSAAESAASEAVSITKAAEAVVSASTASTQATASAVSAAAALVSEGLAEADAIATAADLVLTDIDQTQAAVDAGLAATSETNAAASAAAAAASALEIDHSTFTKLDGSRAFTGPVVGVDPVDAQDLATRAYVLANSGGSGDFKADGSVAMTGTLNLQSGAPTIADEATRKDYVDTADAARLALSGGTMTGVLELSADSAGALEPITQQEYIADKASTVEYRAGTTGKRVETDVWAAGGEVTLTDVATILVDMALFLNATVTLAGNRTLGSPSNAKVGQSGAIRIVQDATGSRTLAFAANWEFAGGSAPTLSTAANAEDILVYQVLASGRVLGSLLAEVS